MYYGARMYDPYLNHFTQPDTIVPDPYNSQDYDRYSYVRNNPLKYTDPSGHDPEGNCYDRGYCPEDPDFHKGYMGGATPADPPEFLGDGDVPSTGGPHDPRGWSSAPGVLSEGQTLYEMYNEGGDPTLKLYLGYQTDADKNVVGITLTIENSGASSARLGDITLTETVLPSFTTSCKVNTTCHFRPDKSVETEPGQATTIKICQNCWADNIKIFSSPFYNNKNSQIKVKVSMSMLLSEDGHTTNYGIVPFVYTISWR